MSVGTFPSLSVVIKTLAQKGNKQKNIKILLEHPRLWRALKTSVMIFILLWSPASMRLYILSRPQKAHRIFCREDTCTGIQVEINIAISFSLTFVLIVYKLSAHQPHRVPKLWKWFLRLTGFIHACSCHFAVIENIKSLCIRKVQNMKSSEWEYEEFCAGGGGRIWRALCVRRSGNMRRELLQTLAELFQLSIWRNKTSIN